MPVWPEVPESFTRLRERFFLAPHTVLGLAPVAFSSKDCRLDVGCDHQLRRARCDQDRPGELRTRTQGDWTGPWTCGVSSLRIQVDLRAAAKHGMRTAYTVARLHDYGDDYDDTGFDQEFDVIAADFAELADTLM